MAGLFDSLSNSNINDALIELQRQFQNSPYGQRMQGGMMQNMPYQMLPGQQLDPHMFMQNMPYQTQPGQQPPQMQPVYYNLPEGWTWPGMPNAPIDPQSPGREQGIVATPSAPQRNPQRQALEQIIQQAQPDSTQLEGWNRQGLTPPQYLPSEFAQPAGNRKHRKAI